MSYRVLHKLIPKSTRKWFMRQTRRPRVGQVQPADLWQVTPISRSWGGDRGLPVDRYYIERFLQAHAADIHGRVLEIGDNVYTRRFGGGQVLQSDILHVEPGNPRGTIVADLAAAEDIPSQLFDCIICVQTLQLIFDVPAAICTLERLLRPDGVALVTVPGISQIARAEMERWGDYWRFTTLSAHRLFADVFPTRHLTVQASGNVLAALAFLHGLASEELDSSALDVEDPDYQVVIQVRAMKPAK